MLDTNSLDVFAMEPVTLRWVSVELTWPWTSTAEASSGLRLSPVSTKAVDAALLLYEPSAPDSKAAPAAGSCPTRECRRSCWSIPTSPPATPGCRRLSRRPWWSTTARSTCPSTCGRVCARFGIRIQPARPLQATDKGAWSGSSAPCARTCWPLCRATRAPTSTAGASASRTEAYYFVDELEQILREWVAERYHQCPTRRAGGSDGPGPAAIARPTCSKRGWPGPGGCASRPEPTWSTTSCPSIGGRSSTTGWSSAACATTGPASPPTATGPAPTPAPTREVADPLRPRRRLAGLLPGPR